MQDAADSDGIGEQTGGLSQTPLVVNGTKLPRIQKCIPVGHVDLGLVNLARWILKLGEEAARDEVVVVLVNLTQGVADFEMAFVVVNKMLLAARDGDATVGA